MQTDPDLRPVVVAVDNSDSARDAAAWAADFAVDWSAPLHVLHVEAGDPQDLPPPAPTWLEELGEAAERRGSAVVRRGPGRVVGRALVAVHAWSDVEVRPDGSPSRRHESPASLATESADVLETRLAPVRARHPRLEIERQLVEGTPLRTLIDRVPGARMLVVGTRGETGHAGIMMGSASIALLEFAPCPVVVVHGRRAVPASAVRRSDAGAQS